MPSLPESDEDDDGIALQDAVFDPEKTVCCSVEGGHTLLHGSGGRGYGLGATGITAGCYQWKVSAVDFSFLVRIHDSLKRHT